MITLYYLENSRAFRVLWLLNELQLEHELKVYSRIGGKKAVRLSHMVLSTGGCPWAPRFFVV